MSNRLSQLINIKELVAAGSITKPQDLKERVLSLTDGFWSGINNVFKENCADLSRLHSFLIEKVIQLHLDEESSYNKVLMEANLSMRETAKLGNDSKSAYRIYSFNKPSPYVFIGDLHSDDASLRYGLDKCSLFKRYVKGEDIRLIFTGDYVDRGKAHLKLMERVLTLKYIFPDNVFLLRGNHDGGVILEDGSLKLPFRILQEDAQEGYFCHYLIKLAKENPTISSSLLEEYLKLFQSLNLIAIINNHKAIMAVHGGIPRPVDTGKGFYKHINSIKELTDDTILDSIGKTVVENILWSDPYRGEGDLRERLGRFCFTQEQFECFKKRFDIDLLVRGHEGEALGYRKHFNDDIYTIFSTGGKLDQDSSIVNTESAYDWVSPKILEVSCQGNLKVY